MKYRVVTQDGFILVECGTLTGAQYAANQQSNQLKESIVIKRYERSIEDYLEVETVANF